MVESNLPKVWRKLLTDPDELLVELVNDTLEKMSGYRADTSHIEAFLRKTALSSFPDSHPADPPRANGAAPPSHSRHAPSQPSAPRPLVLGDHTNYTGTTLVSIDFDGHHYMLTAWIDMLLTLSRVILQSHQYEVEKLFALRGYQHPYFTRNSKELRKAKLIGGTDIYVESNMSARSIVQLSYKLLGAFGYRDTDLHIAVKAKNEIGLTR